MDETYNPLDSTRETQPQPLELFNIGSAAQAFYGANQNQLTGDHNGTRLVLNATGEPIVAGHGNNEQAALADALDRMREQETALTRRRLVDIPMSETATVQLVTLDDHTPIIAPGSPVYALPQYVKEMIGSDRRQVPTYEHTVAQSGWQESARSVVSTYLQHTAEGQALATSLKIGSLDHLTPSQAVKLSTVVVRNLSQYSLDDARRADEATTSELLLEGLQRRGDPTWSGNGVCRNIAANVQIVFEALKQTQGPYSMLDNTYCACETGSDGTGYRDRRQDSFEAVSLVQDPGHAWNTFVTVDSKGSAIVSKIDATWALGASADPTLRDVDQTDRRSVALATTLLKQSERAAEAFPGVSDYFSRLINGSRRRADRNSATEQDFQAHVATEWLRVARTHQALRDTALPAGVLGTFVDVAVRISGRLDRSEIATLYALDVATSGLERGRIGHIIRQYDRNPALPVSGENQGKRVLFDDPSLQRLAYENLGPERVSELADKSGAFRARLRALEPNRLPPFDAEHREADLAELVELASYNSIHDKSPASIMEAFRRKLRAACPDQQTYQAITTRYDDYAIASNFRAIVQELRANSPKA